MKRLRLMILSVLLAFPVVGVMASPASACTSQFEPNGCDIVNRVCQRYFGASCLG